MRFFITGDIHGNIERFSPHSMERKGYAPLTKDDVVLICGDFGIPWHYGIGDTCARWNGRIVLSGNAMQLKNLQDIGALFLFIDGNHEDFDLLEKYPVKTWNGGKVHELQPNLLHLMRVEVFNMEGIRFFTFGGAKSVDKEYRIENESWWAREIPSEKEYRHALKNLKKADNKVDFVFSHTAPAGFVVPFAKKLGFNPTGNYDRTMEMLTEIEKRISYQMWWFGHFHENFVDKERKARWIYESIDCIDIMKKKDLAKIKGSELKGL